MRTDHGGLRPGAPWGVEIELGGQTWRKLLQNKPPPPEHGVALFISAAKQPLIVVGGSTLLLFAGANAEAPVVVGSVLTKLGWAL